MTAGPGGEAPEKGLRPASSVGTGAGGVSKRTGTVQPSKVAPLLGTDPKVAEKIENDIHIHVRLSL